MFLQPFFAYQATRTVTVTLQSETTANSEVDENRWTGVPINVIFAKLSSSGAFPASYSSGSADSWRIQTSGRRGRSAAACRRIRCMSDKYQRALSKTRVVLIVTAFAVAATIYAIRHVLGM